MPDPRTQRAERGARRDREPRHEPGWPVAIGLIVTIVASIGFVVAFVRDAGAGWTGGCLGAALLGLGLALAYWGRDLVGDEVAAAPYPLPPSDMGGGAGLAADLEQDLDVITRRGFLSKLLVAGLAVFGLSQVVLVATFGPRTRDTLTSTQWRAGSRLATIDGRLVTPATLGDNGLMVVFPEGHLDAADSQVTLLRPPADRYRPVAGREEWSPEGYVAYSRVCTHAGCPVAQYEDEAQVLVCPCHQSTFDVLDGARPLSGPAGRALPQLPLMIDAGGYLAARSDFVEPVGPGFWSI